jgi:hypothetical protein
VPPPDDDRDEEELKLVDQAGLNRLPGEGRAADRRSRCGGLDLLHGRGVEAPFDPGLARGRRLERRGVDDLVGRPPSSSATYPSSEAIAE